MKTKPSHSLRSVGAARLIAAAFLLGVIAGCGASNDADPEDDASRLTAESPQAGDEVDAERSGVLQQAATDLAKAAAEQFSRESATPSLGAFSSFHCAEPARWVADPYWEGEFQVSLGACSFTFGEGEAAATLTATPMGEIVVRGMPDPDQPEDRISGQRPAATTTRVERAWLEGASFISAGAVPKIAPSFSFSDRDALRRYAKEIATRANIWIEVGEPCSYDEAQRSYVATLGITARLPLPKSDDPNVKYYCAYSGGMADFLPTYAMWLAFEVDGENVVGLRMLEHQRALTD